MGEGKRDHLDMKKFTERATQKEVGIIMDEGR